MKYRVVYLDGDVREIIAEEVECGKEDFEFLGTDPVVVALIPRAVVKGVFCDGVESTGAARPDDAQVRP